MSIYVHFTDRDDRAAQPAQPAQPVKPLEAMLAHPRTPGTLWEAIGWKREQAANLRADQERGIKRSGWFSTNDDKAA